LKKLIVTGGAGFIGSNLIKRLLDMGEYHITCIDNFDPFYSPKIKEKNIEEFLSSPYFRLVREDIRNLDELRAKLDGEYDTIIHLAAKAGVRPSIQFPLEYQLVNVIGTQNLLEIAKDKNIKQFVFGSSSSIYGINPRVPWSESDLDLDPISPYASSKLSAEYIGRVYSNLYGVRFLALRFFTVYGPGQRPDLAIHKFAKFMLNDEPITKYGDGSTLRDYTFVQDIINGILSAMKYEDSLYEIINIGNNRQVSLNELIETLEEVMEMKAKITQMGEQPGDVKQTYANISKAQKLLNYDPSTSLKEGLTAFAKWVKETEKLLLK